MEMTVNLRDLSTQSYGLGITFWSYKAGDHPPGALLEPGYWDEAAAPSDQPWHKVLCAGDWIFASGRDFGIILYVHQSGERVVVSCVSASIPAR
jgi:hypothetical protein